MFWDKGYTPTQHIEALLEKEDSTVEEFLDDEDILQECKSQKKGIINYFTRPDVLRRLVELITTEPSDDLPLHQRFRHANMACEILTLGLPYLDEKLLNDAEALRTLYAYLERDPPLNPLLSSFFSKTLCMLFTKKPEMDWFLYQQMCLQLLEFMKSQGNFLDLICRNFSTPVLPELILQMMRDVQGGQIKRNLYEWLAEDRLVERLIEILDNPTEEEKHANVSEFLCDLVQQGRSMRQTEYENDSFEPAFNGSNPVLKRIESDETIKSLLDVILRPGTPESGIVSGISILLSLIMPSMLVDEPNSDRLKLIQDREQDIHQQILTTVMRVIESRLNEFNELLRHPPNKQEVVTSAATLAPPFGMPRLQVCRLFTVLLQTRREEISKAICETDFFQTLIALFKQYCWNNFLHNEVEKCFHLIFYTQSPNSNSTQGSTVVNDGSFSKNSNNDDNGIATFAFFLPDDSSEGDGGGDTTNGDGGVFLSNSDGDVEVETPKIADEPSESDSEGEVKENVGDDAQAAEAAVEAAVATVAEVAAEVAAEAKSEEDVEPKDVTSQPSEDEINENDATKILAATEPTPLQTHVIVNCKVISQLIDCWKNNSELESVEGGRRLGYMGHLIKIFKHITNCISESEHIGVLIEANLADEAERELWTSIVDINDGALTQALATQSKMLANCNVNDSSEYTQQFPDTYDCNAEELKDYNNPFPLVEFNAVNEFNATDIFSMLGVNYDENSFEFFPNTGDDEEDDEDNDNNESVGHFGKVPVGDVSSLDDFGVSTNPWNSADPFGEAALIGGAPSCTTGGFDSDNFADFDAHFNSFANDLGDALADIVKAESQRTSRPVPDLIDIPNILLAGEGEAKVKKEQKEFDNNANVEIESEAALKLKALDKAEEEETLSDESAARSVAQCVRSVMQDSEDDYEDDEGMWTKPLGGSANVELGGQGDVPKDAEAESPSVPNGPSKADTAATEPLTTAPEHNSTVEPASKVDNSAKPGSPEASTDTKLASAAAPLVL